MRYILRHGDIEWNFECHITSPIPNIKVVEHPKEIEKLLQKYEKLFRDLPHGRPPDRGDDNYRILNGLVYYKGRIYLVQYSNLKYEIFQEAHDSC